MELRANHTTSARRNPTETRTFAFRREVKNYKTMHLYSGT